MKKFILVGAIAASCIMCKKGETTASSAGVSADSLYSATPENMNEVQEKADAALDSAGVRIRDFEKTTDDVKDRIENTSKIVDSLSDKISKVSLESGTVKKDSARKEEKIVVNVPAPKVIRETKVIYKEKSGKENFEIKAPKNQLIKTGTLELSVNDAETVKETVKDEVSKYDGHIRSENISTGNDGRKTAYLKIKVPLRKFDYLMDDLSYNMGDVENKSIDVTGQQVVENSLCEIDVTLYGKDSGSPAGKAPETFGEKSFAAVSSGWNVITSVFLFLLPLWPVFLIAGAGYYFYKKNRTTKH